MSTTSQITANQLNAQLSTGPRSENGKVKSSRNAVKLGLFTMRDLVRPDQEAEYHELASALWSDVKPEGALQESLVVEIIRANWRLQRCAEVESNLLDSVLETGLDPMQNEANLKIQTAVDRARAQSQNAVRRATADLRRLQTDRNVNKRLAEGEPVQELGLASAAQATTALHNVKKLRKFMRETKSEERFSKILGDVGLSVVNGRVVDGIPCQ